MQEMEQRRSRPSACRSEMRFPPGPPLREISELDDNGVRLDHAKRVSSARLVFAHHEILQHDFPWLADEALLQQQAKLRKLPERERVERLRQVREGWLLEHAGIISTAQAKQTVTNTRIQVAGKARVVWRPTNYGRACVVPVSAPLGEERLAGLIDVKGTGVSKGIIPALQHHSSGLCTLGEVLREVLFQFLIDELFQRAAPWFWTLPIYGVIDLGFDARTRGGERLPAGLLVRRAHQRPAGGIQLPWRSSIHERTQVAIELLLRNYGLTSANRGTRFRFEEGVNGVQVFYAGDPVTDVSDDDRKVISGWLRGTALPLECDGINIQMTRNIAARGKVRAQLLDFDNFEMRKRFIDPVVSLVCDRVIRWSTAIWPNDPGFVQPSASLCVSQSKWGFEDLTANQKRPRRAEGEGPFMLCHDLARNFRSRHISGEQLREQLNQYVSDSIEHW